MSLTRTSRDFPQIGRIHYRRSSAWEARFIYREVVEDDSYLRNGITLRPKDTIFDVGAHIGIFARYGLKQCEGACRLFCFEPIPETHAWLRTNLGSSAVGPLGDVTVLNCGLGATGGPAEAAFTSYPRFPSNSTLTPERTQAELARFMSRHRPGYLATHPLIRPLVRPTLRWLYRARQVRCPMTTISEVCRTHRVDRIDLLKIDVEGAEMDVLAGIEPDLWSSIRQIVLEVHALGDRIPRLVELLAARGFENVVVEQPDWSKVGDFDNHNVFARRIA